MFMTPRLFSGKIVCAFNVWWIVIYFKFCNKCFLWLSQDDYEGYEAIAERLERVLNLRMVTAGTELHDIMQDCLRIAGGVPVQMEVLGLDKDDAQSIDDVFYVL